MSEDLNQKTLKELKQDLVNLGMPETEVNSFNTKGQAIAIINTLKAKNVVEKVDSLEDKDTPGEARKFETHYRSKAMVMKEKLDAQPKVRILVPCEGDEKPGVVEWREGKSGEKYQYHVSGAVLPVQINGYKFLISKGTYTEVPQQVADIVSDSLQQTNEAGKDISMDRIDSRSGKLIKDVM